MNLRNLQITDSKIHSKVSKIGQNTSKYPYYIYIMLPSLCYTVNHKDRIGQHEKSFLTIWNPRITAKNSTEY